MAVQYGLVLPGTSATSLTANQPFSQGKQGEVLDSNLHGTFYQAAYYGNLFHGHTLTAGTTIPVQTTNLASTFTLWNPLGSGVNVELVRYSFAFITATTVVSDVSLYWQTSVGNANAVPTSLTALSVRSALLSSSSVNPIANAKAALYSAATLTNTMATNMFRGPTLFGPGAVTSTQEGPNNYDFNGTILLGPGTLVTTAGNAAQTAATAQSLVWAEWPL